MESEQIKGSINKGMHRYLCIVAAYIATIVVPPAHSESFSAFGNNTDNTSQQISDSELSFDDFKQQQNTQFDDFKTKINAEFDTFKKITREETTKYSNKVNKVWDQPELSTNKVWIKYSKDLNQQQRVDFENRTIQISWLNDNNNNNNPAQLRKTLRELITKNKAQAFQQDPISQAIEKRSRAEIRNLKTDTVKPTPIIMPFLTGKEQVSKQQIDRIINNMIAKKRDSKTTDSRGNKVTTITVPLEIPDKKTQKKLPAPAKALASTVYQQSKKNQIDPEVIFAIIETESSFNPMARSSVPAYGLMQIVPRSAGQDATAKLFGKAKILSPSYLYNSDNNIQIGSTYLNILYYRYLRKIKNPKSRLFCAIAAYNTGAGNVARAFTNNTRIDAATKKINQLSPQQVYQHLVTHLPYDETRRYIKKVNRRIVKYSTELKQAQKL